MGIQMQVNAKMNNCNGKIPVRLIKKYSIQLLDENTLAIETVVKIVNGEDYQAVIAEMEELVSEHIFS